MSDYIGKETEITVAGKTYKLSRFTRAIRKEFCDWVRSQLPDPMEICAKHIHGFPPEIQKEMYHDAWKAANEQLDVTSPKVQQMSQTIEGSCKLLQLLLKEHHPELTEDEAFDLAMKYVEEHSSEDFRGHLEALRGDGANVSA